MKSLYVTSVEPFSGKTALLLAIGNAAHQKGHKLAYLKPLSTQPYRTPAGELADEDADFVRSVLDLETPASELAGVVVTSETLRERLKASEDGGWLEMVKQRARAFGEASDLLLIEGGGSLREGYAMGLSNPGVAQALGSPVLVVVKYRGEMALVDDALTARFRLGDQLMGVVLNHIPDEANDFLESYALPFLTKQGIQVLGKLPLVPSLSAMSVDELRKLLEAQVLTDSADLNVLADTFTVGAMNAEAALSRFRRQQNKAVITGGDRTDIQLSALETSTVALILTGNLHPNPVALEQAESLGVPVLLVETNTMETVEKIERAYGKTRLGHTEKLRTFFRMVSEGVDLGSIWETIGLG